MSGMSKPRTSVWRASSTTLRARETRFGSMVRQFEKYAAQVVVFLDEVGDEREDWLTHNDGVKVRQALDTLLTACGRPAGRPAGWQQACSGTAAAR